MDFKDYYQTLGVAKTATEKEIKQAFRKLARKFHPDVNPGDKTAEPSSRRSTRPTRCSATPTSGASTTSSAPTGGCTSRRSSRARASPAGVRTASGGGAQDAWTINMGGAGGGYRTMTDEEMQDLFGNEDPFSDFFRTFFGGGGARDGGGRARGGRRGRATQKGQRHRARGRADARRGVSRRDAADLDQGRRARAQRGRAHPGRRQGRLARARRRRRRSPGANGGAAGDLYLRVRVRPHPVFERKGDDLHTKVAVPVTTAVLGGEAQVPTVTGCGAAEDSRGHAERPGLPAEGPRHAGRRQAGRRGDLYATVDVQLPRALTRSSAALRGAAEWNSILSVSPHADGAAS